MRILVEEAVRKEQHRPAMNTDKYGRINIIPSILWGEDPGSEGLSGTISHESIHLTLVPLFGWEVTAMFDNLPMCTDAGHAWLHDFGLCGWGLKGWEWKANFLMD